MTKEDKYAIDQHSLVCMMLGVSKSYKEDGDTAFEAVCDLKNKLEEYQKENIRLRSALDGTVNGALSSATHYALEDEIKFLRKEKKELIQQIKELRHKASVRITFEESPPGKIEKTGDKKVV